MTRFWLIKFMRTALTLWLVVTFTFIVLRTSGDPVVALLGGDAMPDEIEQFRQQWGLDRPLIVQYLSYIGQMATGQFGDSLRDHRPVMDIILERVPATLSLGLAAYLLAPPASSQPCAEVNSSTGRSWRSPCSDSHCRTSSSAS